MKKQPKPKPKLVKKQPAAPQPAAPKPSKLSLAEILDDREHAVVQVAVRDAIGEQLKDKPIKGLKTGQYSSIEKDLIAFELRKGGMSYTEIGRIMGVSTVAAFNRIKRLMMDVKEKRGEEVAEVRRLEVERCDKYLNALWVKIKMGYVECIDTALRVADRRAKLLGLDVPQNMKLEGTGEGGAILVETFRRMVQEAVKPVKPEEEIDDDAKD